MSVTGDLTVSVIDKPGGADSPLLQEAMDKVRLKRLLPTEVDNLDPETEIILIRGGFWSDLPKLLRLAPRLKWIHINMAGVEHLDRSFLADKGVALTNAAGVLDRAIAEFALGAALVWTKGLHRSVLHTQSRQWKEREPLLNSGLRALIIGAGGIGTKCAEMLKSAGFGSVTGIRQSPQKLPPVFDDRFELRDLQQKVREFDIVISSLPATNTTSSVLNESVFGNFKESMVLVNVGRGTTVDHHHLAKALRERPDSLAVLDVSAPEPLPPEHPLWKCSNVILSPHMAGETRERHDNYSRLFLENLSRYSQGLPLRNQVLI